MIDVFIPTYNRPEKLERCLKSIQSEGIKTLSDLGGGYMLPTTVQEISISKRYVVGIHL